jgi:hypothetical protein
VAVAIAAVVYRPQSSRTRTHSERGERPTSKKELARTKSEVSRAVADLEPLKRASAK